MLDLQNIELDKLKNALSWFERELWVAQCCVDYMGDKQLATYTIATKLLIAEIRKQERENAQ